MSLITLSMTLEQLVLQVLSHARPTKDIFLQAKKDYGRINKISGFPSNMQILQVYRDLVKSWIVPESKTFQELLKKRAIRSQSGIVSVQVLTKPFWCPGKCIFCPNDFTMPKSYINTEPGAMRALLNNFDPIKQVYNRLLSLTLTGHDTDKIEMIVLGGTWDVYPKEYKEWFIKWLYHACNTFPEFLKTVKLTTNVNKSLFAIEDAETASSSSHPELVSGSLDSGSSPEWHQWRIEDSIQSLISKADTIATKKKEVRDTDLGDPILTNETAEHRIIWLTVETRPEYVTDENCQFWRELGVTRLEMGIQSTNDEVLDMNKRWHNVECCKAACHKLRQYGFKFSVHLMPGLYGSDENKDLQTFIDIYSDDHFKPDEIKFYPTSVIPNTELYELYKQGKYKPIETDAIKRIITNTFRDIIPPYTRIKRLIRDIPSTEIAAGSSITNLAQLMHEWLYKERKWTDTIKKIYTRLYENAQYYETIEEYLKTCHSELVSESRCWNEFSMTEKWITTHIIGWPIDTESDRAFVSLDTRSREIRHNAPHIAKGNKEWSDSTRIIIRHYNSSVGQEFFVSIEDTLGYLYGFTRLLLPEEHESINYPWLGLGTALIRELHVYGQLAGLKESEFDKEKSIVKNQHTGIGTQVMSIAAQITKQRGYKKISVIAWVWVREYYRNKIWYHLEGTYMVKEL